MAVPCVAPPSIGGPTTGVTHNVMLGDAFTNGLLGLVTCGQWSKPVNSTCVPYGWRWQGPAVDGDRIQWTTYLQWSGSVLDSILPPDVLPPGPAFTEADIDNVWFVAKFGSAPYPVKDFSYNDGCAGPRVFVYTQPDVVNLVNGQLFQDSWGYTIHERYCNGNGDNDIVVGPEYLFYINADPVTVRPDIPALRRLPMSHAIGSKPNLNGWDAQCGCKPTETSTPEEPCGCGAFSANAITNGTVGTIQLQTAAYLLSNQTVDFTILQQGIYFNSANGGFHMNYNFELGNTAPNIPCNTALVCPPEATISLCLAEKVCPPPEPICPPPQPPHPYGNGYGNGKGYGHGNGNGYGLGQGGRFHYKGRQYGQGGAYGQGAAGFGGYGVPQPYGTRRFY